MPTTVSCWDKEGGGDDSFGLHCMYVLKVIGLVVCLRMLTEVVDLE